MARVSAESLSTTLTTTPTDSIPGGCRNQCSYGVLHLITPIQMKNVMSLISHTVFLTLSCNTQGKNQQHSADLNASIPTIVFFASLDKPPHCTSPERCIKALSEVVWSQLHIKKILQKNPWPSLLLHSTLSATQGPKRLLTPQGRPGLSCQSLWLISTGHIGCLWAQRIQITKSTSHMFLYDLWSKIVQLFDGKSFFSNLKSSAT